MGRMHAPGHAWEPSDNLGGPQTSTCPACSEDVPSKRLPGHIADEHGDGGDDDE